MGLTMDNNHQFINHLLECQSAGTMPVIAEIKAQTPSSGDLLRGRSIEEIALQYEHVGATCISVVTGRWFGGTTAYLTRAVKVSSLPILRKDFIVSRSEIKRSKQLGAAAVLLTKQLINKDQLEALSNYALSIGLTPFIEVGSAKEILDLKVDSKAILAICNRDISVKETDDGNITTSLSLLGAARTCGAGAVVSASAISTAEEAKQLIDAGFDGLLIGSAFLQSHDLLGTLNNYREALLGENVS